MCARAPTRTRTVVFDSTIALEATWCRAYAALNQPADSAHLLASHGGRHGGRHRSRRADHALVGGHHSAQQRQGCVWILHRPQRRIARARLRCLVSRIGTIDICAAFDLSHDGFCFADARRRRVHYVHVIAVIVSRRVADCHWLFSEAHPLWCGCCCLRLRGCRLAVRRNVALKCCGAAAIVQRCVRKSDRRVLEFNKPVVYLRVCCLRFQPEARHAVEPLDTVCGDAVELVLLLLRLECSAS